MTVYLKYLGVLCDLYCVIYQFTDDIEELEAL